MSRRSVKIERLVIQYTAKRKCTREEALRAVAPYRARQLDKAKCGGQR